MNSDLYQIKRARFNLDFANSLSFDKEMDTSCINYNPANKPLPSDLAEFLADPYRFRVSEEFLNTVVLEVRQLNMLCTHRNSLPPPPPLPPILSINLFTFVGKRNFAYSLR
jgi:hypothetical protein